MGLKVIQVLTQSGNKISRMQKYASQPSALPLSSLPKSAQEALSDLLGITIGKKGRTISEQIQHLNQNWVKSVKSAHVQGQQNTLTQINNIELYTKQGKSTKYLKIGNELYYVPKDSQEYKAYEFVDNLYNKFLGQTRNIDKKGHFGFGFNKSDNFGAYKYIEADASIADYPNLLKDGFGLDCLLSTPISAKSVIVKNSQAVRLENGLTKYIGYIGGSYGIKCPEELITQEVRISKYFEPESEAYDIVKNFTEKDISFSLKKLNKINENDLVIAHNKMTNLIDGDYLRIEEQLKLRKEYLLKYAELIEQYPKKNTESMFEYLQKIESYLPKHKEVTVPIDDFVIKMEPDAVLRSVEENWQAFKQISKQKFVNSSTDILEDGTFTHNAMIDNLESILDNGLTTGQATLATKIVSGSNVGGNYTSTPAQLDTFIVRGKQSIKEYFNPSNRHQYENGFMQHNKKVCYTIDKTRIKDFQKTFKLRTECGLRDLKTHYTIPFGVPASCIDRIIVRSDLS